MAAHPWVAAGDGALRFGVLVTGSRGRDADGAFPLYEQPIQQMAATARQAEALGYDAIFVGDHPTILPDPFISLSALATATERLRLGTLVTIPFFRHPTMLARLASDLDQLSRGRLILGLGIGQIEDDFQALGLPFLPVPERQQLLAETAQTLQAIWRHETTSYQGSQIPAAAIEHIPAPMQQPGPPLIIAGGGKQTLGLAASYADGCNLAGPWGAVTPEEVRAKLDVLRRACDQQGRASEEVLRTYIAVIVVAADEARLEAKLAQFFTPAFIEMRRQTGYIVAGTPERMVGYLRGLSGAGIQYIVVHLADTADTETLELLASEVIPQFQ